MRSFTVGNLKYIIFGGVSTHGLLARDYKLTCPGVFLILWIIDIALCSVKL